MLDPFKQAFILYYYQVTSFFLAKKMKCLFIFQVWPTRLSVLLVPRAHLPSLRALQGTWAVINGDDISNIVSELYTSNNAQVVTNLQQTCNNAVPTTCQQDVFALLVPSLLKSCQRLVDNLLQGCCAQQTCHNKLFQQLVIILKFNNLSTNCEW